MKTYQKIPIQSILENKALKPIYDFVELKHRGQLREGQEKIPHLNHLLLVFEISMNAITDMPLKYLSYKRLNSWVFRIASVALLHDVIEDTDCNSTERLSNNLLPFMGNLKTADNIADKVSELSNPPGIREEDKRAWQAAHAKIISSDSKIIKISDMIANVIDIIEHPPLWTFQEKWEFIDKTVEITDCCVNYLPKSISVKYKVAFKYLNQLSKQVCKYGYSQLRNREIGRSFIQDRSR